MRLRKPRVDSVESSDGASALHFERLVPGRNGGALYRFTVSPGDGSQAEISARVLVTAVTSFYAAKYAKGQGLDFDELSFVKQTDYLNKFAEKYGRTNSVREFVIENKDLDSGQVPKIIELFVELFLNSNLLTGLTESRQNQKDVIPISSCLNPMN